MGKVNLFKEFKNTINNNSPSFKTVNELNDIILEIKLNPSELSEKQEIKLNKLEPKLERFEDKVIINKLNDTSLIHKNEILNTVADLDTSVIKPFINTINKINETDLPEILAAIQSIPTTDLKPALDEIKTDVIGFLAALESVPTVENINSAVEQITVNIMGNDYLEDAGEAPTVPELMGTIESKFDEITGAINNINCAEAPVVSAGEEAVLKYETKAAEYSASWGVIDNSEFESLSLIEDEVMQHVPVLPAFDTEEYVLWIRYIAMRDYIADQYCVCDEGK